MSTEETPERPRRQRQRQWTIVSVATAVLLAGGGGAYWASNATGGDTSPAGSSADPPALALDSLGREEAGDGPSRDIAPGEPAPDGPVYRAEGDLPKGPETARVYRPDKEVTGSEVTALAEALKLPGKPERSGESWRVMAAKDGSGPSLTVGAGKTAGSWSFSRYVPSGDDRCAKPPKGSDAMPMPCPQPEGSGPDGGDPVSEERAERAVQPVLRALGLQGAELETASTHGALRVISARTEVGGLAAHDWTSTFTVGPDGVLAQGQGRMGELERGAEYPVMTAAETLKELNAHRGAIVGDVVCPTPRDGAAGRPQDGGAGFTSECSPPQQPKDVKVTGATFGLAVQYTRGDAVLVPAWAFEVRQPGGAKPYQVNYPAVEPEYVKQAEKERDTGRVPAPSKPGYVQAISSYEDDGRTLSLTFWAGVCHTYAAKADESRSKVIVSVEPQKEKDGTHCIQIAKKQTVKVKLDAPLGDRAVVNERDGKPLEHTW